MLLVSCPRDFGGFHRTSAIGRTLANCGHEVTVYFRGERGRLTSISTVSEENCRFVELPRISFPFFTKAVSATIIVALILLRRPDIVHVFASVHPEHLAAIATCRLIGLKCVVDWDDLWTDSPLCHARGSVVRRYLKWSESFGPRFATAVTVVSDFLESKARHLTRRPILKVPNGVWRKQFTLWERCAARQALGIPQGRLVVLAFGNSYLQGRGKLLIECADAILRSRLDAEIIVNVDPLQMWREDGEGQAPPITLPAIRCVGQIAPADLGKYLAAADFVLFPTTDSPGERACFPIRLGTYLNGECPIATNSVPTEAAGLVERYGCGILGTSPSELAAKIEFVAADEVRMEALRGGVRRAKEDLDWEKLVKQLEGLYTTV